MKLIEILPLSKRRLDVLFEIYSSKRDYLRSISSKLSINPSLCSRILKSLHSAKVLDREQQGKEVFYSLAKGSELLIPILEDFNLSIRTENSNKLDILIKLIRERKELMDACNYIYIFGSYAVGTETKESDIDVLFISNEKKIISRAVRELSILLSKQINAIVYSKREFNEKLKSRDPLVYSIVNAPKERLVVK